MGSVDGGREVRVGGGGFHLVVGGLHQVEDGLCPVVEGPHQEVSG